MKKIPTLFKRDPDDMRRVLPEVTPGCEWVLAGEGVPTRKYDGTCVLLDGNGKWWARREVKRGRPIPRGWTLVERDGATGKMVGWEPIGQSPFAKFHQQALDEQPGRYEPGTYELCGPKVNGNPEGFESHILISHALAIPFGRLDLSYEGRLDLSYEGLAAMLSSPAFIYEGIVWHHADGRMAKLKRRDFDGPRPADNRTEPMEAER